jgi:subtilase family serine protease
MFCSVPRAVSLGLLILFGDVVAGHGAGFGRQPLPERMPPLVARMKSLGRVPSTNRLHLTFSLPLRDPAGLDELIRELYDPASPHYRHFLTPQAFTARFGPSESDYAALLNFVRTNGFEITGTQPSRTLVDVTGSAATVERVFGVTLHRYRHPHEARDFYAPDAEPSITAPVRLLKVYGLDNFSLPHPRSHLRAAAALVAQAVPRSGSGSGGSYLGSDFRAAYVPGTPLTGSGQSVALVQFDGYYAQDIQSYLTTAG